jgi:RNA recognition motif-containing protein
VRIALPNSELQERVLVTLHVYNRRREKIRMAKKLYVGGVPYSSTDADLRDAFSQAGEVVSATIIMDRMSGRSKGFGFVEMATDDAASKAIEMWNGKDFQGRKLTVNEARPMQPRDNSRRDNGGSNNW